MNKQQSLSRNYDRAAWFYETSAHIFSTGQIAASKRDQLKDMQRGDKVLFLGVGAGEDAVMAARAGAHVTCIDISSKMLDKLQRRLNREDLSAELICMSALEFDRTEFFDVCCANYFLNVFKREDMKKMLNHSASLLRQGGKFMIADVALPEGNLLSKAFNLAYLKGAMASYYLMGMVPWHENYDYAAFFEGAGLEFSRRASFRFGRIGPVVFQNLVALKI
ncbi:MAG: class I SAM-dependent methyltransferase [Planctomycetota bacterium]